MSFLASGFLPFEQKAVRVGRKRRRKGDNRQNGRKGERLGGLTDIISVLVRLMEPWPASNGCQQASVGKLSLVQNDLYPRPI